MVSDSINFPEYEEMKRLKKGKGGKGGERKWVVTVSTLRSERRAGEGREEGGREGRSMGWELTFGVGRVRFGLCRRVG